MPADHGNDIGPVGLCAHHRHVVTQMAAHGHVNAEATQQAANDLRRQCCAWRPKEDQWAN